MVSVVISFFFISMISVTFTSGQNLTDQVLTNSVENADIVAIYVPNASTSITIDGNISSNEYPESINTCKFAFLGWKYVKNPLLCQLHSW